MTNADQLMQRQTPPLHCQYALGPCDQEFSQQRSGAFFAFPNEPEVIRTCIEEAIKKLRRRFPQQPWTSWKDLNVTGQIIFCQICKALRFSDLLIADVTTLNFNVLFEIGYALGLGLHVLPIRDTTYDLERRQFEELAILDTFGYLDFQNSEELAGRIPSQIARATPLFLRVELDKDAPVYIVQSPIESEGDSRLVSFMTESPFGIRTFDPRETPRLSLHEAYRHVSASIAVITHLLDPGRSGATVHNARCAFIAGLAMAQSKHVLMLQEGHASQPIDYRDVIQPYADPRRMPDILQRLIKHFTPKVLEAWQKAHPVTPGASAPLLEQVNIGDPAAENEIRSLSSYFYPTGQFIQARNGQAWLVVGRKGSGKTAIFYRLRDELTSIRSRPYLVLDLKPHEYQFVKLREAVLSRLVSLGIKEHALTAFWHYLLVSELALKVIKDDWSSAYQDIRMTSLYQRVQKIYGAGTAVEQGDFSERLLDLIDIITSRFGERFLTNDVVTEVLYGNQIREVADALASYLQRKDRVWLLLDNLDKGWPIRGTTSEDILIVRCLLEACRKIQHQLAGRNIPFHCSVFLRNDIFEHLVQETPDKGKVTVISLDWDDPEAFKEVLRRRIAASTGLEGRFAEVWSRLFEMDVRGGDSFRYILARTLMRPRDLLNFVRKSIEVAINRGHRVVTEGDILQAERAYSQELLGSVAYEFNDTYRGSFDIQDAFFRCPVYMASGEVRRRIREAGAADGESDRVFELLLWFGLLGANEHVEGEERERYAYHILYDRYKLRVFRREESVLVIHPAFRSALECQQ